LIPKFYTLNEQKWVTLRERRGSFTVRTILTGNHDPFTEVVGLTVGGLTIADAVFGIFSTEGSVYCASFGASGTDAFNCGLANRNGIVGIHGDITNPTTVGVYSYTAIAGFGGFPAFNQLTISETGAVPETKHRRVVLLDLRLGFWRTVLSELGN